MIRARKHVSAHHVFACADHPIAPGPAKPAASPLLSGDEWQNVE
jgi:hypothetical protein